MLTVLFVSFHDQEGRREASREGGNEGEGKEGRREGGKEQQGRRKDPGVSSITVSKICIK